jgi:hypothetical protein
MKQLGSVRLKRLLILGAFLGSIVVRLVLTADRDIFALNAPYDDYWYINSAMRWIFGGSYNHMIFVNLPIYSIWLKSVSLLGIPARLAIDVFWLLACAYLAIAVARLCGRWWPGILLYLFLCFHPYSILLFDRALSETLLMVLLTFTLAGLIEVWNLRDAEGGWRRLSAMVIVSASFAAAYHTRKEGAVMLAPMLVLLAWSAYHWRVWWAGPNRFRMGYPMLAFPLVITLALGFLLAGANYVRWGVFARYEFAANGFVRAINDLNAIQPGSPTPRQVTVTALTRAKAYEASPTFRELKSFFDGPSGQWLASDETRSAGVPGEISNGWFYWAVRDAAATAGWHSDARNAEKKYAAMAEELERAFADGRLQERSAFIPFVDPDWRKWLPGVPSSFIDINQRVIDATAGELPSSLPEDAKPNQFDDFISVLGRRNPPRNVRLGGWLILPEGSSIALGTPEHSSTWHPVQGALKLDVSGARVFTLVSSPGEELTELHIRAPDGKMSRLPLDELKFGMMKNIEGIPGALLGVDLAPSKRKSARVDVLLPVVTRIWTYVGWSFAVVGFGGLLFFKRREGDGAAIVVMLLSLTAIFARTGLLAVLDASSWSGLQTRYVAPVVPYFAVFGVLGFWILSQRVSVTRHRSAHT